MAQRFDTFVSYTKKSFFIHDILQLAAMVWNIGARVDKDKVYIEHIHHLSVECLWNDRLLMDQIGKT